MMRARNLILAGAALTAGLTFAKPPIRTAVPEPSVDLGTMPDKAYVTDYYAPPVDALPQAAIENYTLNTRVPEYGWLKYDGAYALVLRLHPIAREKIEKEIASTLISTNRNKNALVFDLAAEKSAAVRTVGIYNLDLDATEFKALSFKVRGKAKNAGDALVARLRGTGFNAVLDPSKAQTFEDVSKGAKNKEEIEKRLTKTLLREDAKDGFVGYTLPFAAGKGTRIASIEFELPAATAADFEQSFEVIDLHLKRVAPKARFTDLPARRWTKKSNVFDSDEPLVKAKCIDDVFAYVRGEGAADTLPAMPKGYELRPQLEKEKDGGFTVEWTTAKVGGKDLPAVKITLEKGPRCLLRFPLAFDGLEYNTFTFLAKVETFEGAKPLLGDLKPMLWGTDSSRLNRPFDTFQVSFFSKTDDFCDWTRWGLSQADYCQNKQVEAASSKNADGWRAFAYDIANSDPSNNKSSFYTKISHWCFYYDNTKIPDGKKVTVTIADPRITRGLMLAGGDLKLYKEFLKSHDMNRIVDFKAMDTALEAPKAGRLAKPIRFVENRRAKGAIYVLGPSFPRGTSPEAAKAYRTILDEAVKEFRDVIQRKYAMAEDIRVLDRLPGGKDPKPTNSIIVGGSAYAQVDKATYDADLKALSGKPGCAIRSDGTNVYVYASDNYNYCGNVRGLAFALYELLENNTDLIYSHRAQIGQWGPSWPNRIFEPSASGDFDLVWGDGFVHAPGTPEGNMLGVSGRNRVPGWNWVGSWQNGMHRTRSVNHLWGYGTEPHGSEKRGEPNDTWGRREDGTFMVPGCYTGHPCLIRVLDRARDSYLQSSAFARYEHCFRPHVEKSTSAFAWNSVDVHGLWVEDSLSMCQCAECLTKIRLADGSTVGPDSPYFRSTQFYANGSAMINAVNVYGNRAARIESIGYLWMAPVPLITVSRSYDIRFCPYIRKNYYVPVYAPMNDMHWRAMFAWAQQDVRLSLYEYFLWINVRPWADVAAYDHRAEVELGFYDWHAEAEGGVLSRMEKWVMERLIWGGSGDDVPALRAYYLKRTYREAAEPMGRFFDLVMGAAEKRMTFASPVEFEDEHVIYRNAMRTKAEGLFAGTVADELEKCLDEAAKKAVNPQSAAEVREFREAWEKYRKAALASEEKWQKDLKDGAESKPMKIVGAPD